MTDACPRAAAIPLVEPIEIGSVFDLRFLTPFHVPRMLDLPFDGSLVGEGWYQAETSPTGSFRWMGIAETASVDVVVDRSGDLEAELGIYMVIAPEYEGSLRIGVEGEEGGLAHRRTSTGLSFNLPRRDGDPAVTTLLIHAGKGLVREPDLRRLSVAVSYLRTRAVAGDRRDDSRNMVLRQRLAEQLRGGDRRWPLVADGGDCMLIGTDWRG